MGLFVRDPQEFKPTKAKPYTAHRSLTAAATRINLRDHRTSEILKQRRSSASWQDDAWLYYDAIGEIKYAYKLFTNVLSRIRLYPALVTDENDTPVSISSSDLDQATQDAIMKVARRVFSAANQPNLLRRAGLNMLVAGEGYLVNLPPKYGVRDEEEWTIISVSQLESRNGKYFFKEEAATRPADQEELPAGTFIGRIWNSHAQYSGEADSAMRSLIDVCDDLFLYSRAGRATAKSRLNAGALLVPEGLSVSADTPSDIDLPNEIGDPPQVDESDEDEFEQELMDGLTTPIADEESAAAVVPVIIRGTRDDLKEVRLIKFERSFDPQIAARAERSLERILQGIDLPKDIVTGLANIKYSNAIQIEESLYTAHVEPLVLLLCDAFRTVYLKPALRDAGIDPDLIDRLVIWYDPSAIMTAPDKSNAANVGHDKMILSDESWRRANGFSEDDAPDELEVAQRLAITRGALSEEVTTALLKTLIPQVLEAARAQSIAESPSPLPQGVQDVLGGPQAPPAQPTDGPQPPPIVTEAPNDTPPPPVSAP